MLANLQVPIKQEDFEPQVKSRDKSKYKKSIQKKRTGLSNLFTKNSRNLNANPFTKNPLS